MGGVLGLRFGPSGEPGEDAVGGGLCGKPEKQPARLKAIREDLGRGEGGLCFADAHLRL